MFPHFHGSPCALDLATERARQFVAFRRSQVGSILGGERRRHAVVLLYERTPGDLGGVCGEHQFDAQRTDRVVELVPDQAAVEETRKPFLTGAPLRGRLGVLLVGAPPAYSVMLLGDVGEVEEVCKRSRDDGRVVV